MLKHNDAVTCWNERLKKKMDDMGISQRSFAAQYKKRFGKGSQADVSKWMNVGGSDGRTKSTNGRGFPTYETMQNIAEILGTDVGYLTGETDCDTFEMDDAVKYLGLSADAITAVKNLTSGKSIPPFYKYPDRRYTAALELLLSSDFLIEFLEGICELASTIDRKKNPPDNIKRILDCIPESYRDDALAIMDMVPESNEDKETVADSIKPSPELLAFARILDDASVQDSAQPIIADRDIASAKYTLQEVHMKIIEELTSDGNIQLLLPRYATQEEVEALFKNAVHVND